MIVHAGAARWPPAGDVIVATDSGKSPMRCSCGGKAIGTRADHASGSDRVFEAVTKADPERRTGIIVRRVICRRSTDLVTRCIAPLAEPKSISLR